MNKGNLQDLILAKLGMTYQEMQDIGYADKIFILANECLATIATTVYPYTKSIDVVFMGEYHNESITENTPDYCFYFDSSNNCYKYKSKNDTEFKTGNLPIFDFPDDFVNLSDKIALCDGKPIIGCYTLCGIKQFTIKYAANYKLYYDSWFQDLTEGDDSTILDMPNDVVYCIAPYVASELVRMDDPVMSTVLKNEFELMIARVHKVNDNNTIDYVSPGGWY